MLMIRPQSRASICGRADRQEYRGEVDRDHRIPALDREFVHRRDMLNARVVDQHVDAPEFRRCLLDQSGDLGRLGEVGAAVGHSHTVARGNFLAQLRDCRRLAEAVDHEVGASGSERARDPESDTAGRTGNDSYLALQHGLPPSVLSRSIVTASPPAIRRWQAAASDRT
jgi:hypothetical protein